MTNMNITNGVIQPMSLSLSQAAKYLGCSSRFLLSECKAKRITHHRIGNRFKITMLDLDLYRAEHTVTRDTTTNETISGASAVATREHKGATL